MTNDDPLELDALRLEGERVIGISLERPQVTDVTITDSDLAGVVMSSYVVRRATVTRTRLRDCVWGGGLLQDVAFEECPAGQLSLRFATLQRVTFTDCRLDEADFYGVTFDGVVFDNCDLTGAHFDSATVKQLSLRNCRLAGVTGALALRGASVDLDDLPELAPSLAREVGITLT